MVAVSIFKSFSLCLENLEISHGEGFSLGPLTENFHSGQTVQVIGPNGVGKTSLLRAIAGLLTPSKGNVFFKGVDCDTPFILHVGGKTSGLLPSITVKEQLRLWQLLHKAEDRCLQESIAFFGLEARLTHATQTLSAGEQQRLCLARLIMGNGPLWLLDEPFNGLDVPYQQKLLALLKSHAHKGGLVMITGHQERPLDGSSVLSLGKGGA